MLPPTQRASSVLRYYLGLSEAKVTAELACRLGTVKWRSHAAVKYQAMVAKADPTPYCDFRRL